MERSSSLLRWILIGLGVFLLLQFLPKLFGQETTELQPLRPEKTSLPSSRAPERTCDIWAPTFRAVLSTRGASLKHLYLLTAKYRHNGQPMDLGTMPGLELRRSLGISLRNDALAPGDDPKWQVDFDSFDWTLSRSDGASCTMTYRDSEVEIEKVVSATDRAFQLSVQTTITNRASERRRHSLLVDAADWRRQSEVQGGMFRVSPFLTSVECIGADGKATRLRPEDFEPSDFQDPPFRATSLNPGDWHQVPGSASVAAVSNAYFSNALVPVKAPPGVAPACLLQVEDRWDPRRYKSKAEDPNAGAVYRARLAYPAMELEPGQQAQYAQLSYVGPKERSALQAAGSGNTHLIELIDLGFFSVIAKILVGFLLAVHGFIPNWGVAIIILTLTARTLLFPLAIPSIRSMIKMRELKPEIDELNARFKDDPQAKGLAQMELWRKHKVNPLKGCLPQLASMPVWFALYTTLQTAVELYNIPFLWFPDLSLPDPYFVLPFVIGGTSFVQQKMMPMQGDPTQQKMMLYMMPAMFTVFMLFLPAGLGVYMFTNGVLGIIQQQAVEYHARRSTAAAPSTESTATNPRGDARPSQRPGASSAKRKT